LALSAMLVCSCNKYEKLLKNPDFALKYREANRFYELHKTEKALRLYENVLSFYRNRAQEDTINMQIARCYYALHDYITAAYYFEYVQRHLLHSTFTSEADYMVAICNYNQVLRAELDQSQTYLAIEKLEYYIEKYPVGERTDESRKYLTELENQLAHKSYLSAKLYYQMEQYKAAVVSLKNSIKQYPETPHREEILFLTFKSSYLYAQNSLGDKQQERYQASVDEYLTLVSEYPDSKYKKEADNYYRDVLSKLITNNS
jgi:outer membrane protein assembly factor BamD